jgi:ABC-type lipoprotein export system ATPase subunit
LCQRRRWYFPRLAQKRAVIAVTHDMDFAGMADRRIHIVDGKS